MLEVCKIVLTLMSECRHVLHNLHLSSFFTKGVDHSVHTSDLLAMIEQREPQFWSFDMLQIKSVDYVFEDGQQVQSTRLPGYSGVSGLDAEQDAEDRKMDEFEAVSSFAPCACHAPVLRLQKALLLLWGT